jgi:tetratricopeptide (TPR) repeat protein
VLALGLIGLAAGLKKWRKLFPLYSYIILYSIATVAFYILSRFRLPIVSVLTVFSGAAIVIILENILDRKRLRALAIIAPAALVFALSRPGQPDPLQMSDYHNMARYHIISGQPEKAPEIWNQGMTRARKILEQKPSAQAHFRVALFLYKTGGDPAEALDHLKNAQGMNPPIYLQTPINNLKKSIQNPALINR